MTTWRKILFLLCFVATIVLIVPPSLAWAQSQERYGGYATGNDASFQGDLNAEGATSKAQEDTMGWMVDQILPIPGKTTTADVNSAFFQQRTRNSAMGKITEYTVAMINAPPADLALWVRDTGHTLGFIPDQTYAQGLGIGFSGLEALLPIWRAFRNISYAILAIVLLVVGFMIMLRQKIDAKTVVTVQNALPKIVITLILITFSYAIAGILIDLMYLLILLVVAILAPINSTLFGPDTAAKFINSGFMEVWGRLFGGGFRAADDILRFLNPAAVNVFNGGEKGFLAIPAILQLLMRDIDSIFVTLFILIIVLFAGIRLFFMLVSSYIQIIFSVIFAPLLIVVDAIPGGEGFMSWFRNLAANILVFPVVIAMLMLTIILGTATSTNEGRLPINTPITPNGGPIAAQRIWSPPLLYPGGQFGLTGIIGIGILMAIPGIAGKIRDAIKAQPAYGGGKGGSGLQTGMQLVSTAFYLQQLTPKGLRERLFGAGPGGGHK